MNDLPAIDARVQALRSYGLLDTPRTAEFDDLAMLAKVICGTRFAVVNFVDADRQWFKAELGFGVRELPLDNSICARVMLEDALIEIPDLTQDPRFQCNPLITGDPRLRFYAGAPLVDPEGFVLGTLCVLDTVPMRLAETQKEALGALARQVVAQMQLTRQGAALRQRAADLQQALAQREHAEMERRVLQEDQRFIIDHALAGLVVHDGAGAVVFCNRTASDMLGMSMEQLTGRVPTDPHWHFVDEFGRVMPLEEYPISIVARTREALTDYVVGVVRSAGAEHVWALVNAYPQLAPDGSLVRTVVSFVDISARKQAEDRLREADRRKDEFLAMLAHELRNPLAPISTSVHLLRLSGEATPAVARATEIIGRQVGHLTRLVDDLLDVSRVTRGLVELAREPVDARSVVSTAVEQARPLIQARGHELRMALDEGPFVVDGDFHRLVQVVSNLLNNAAKYTPQGGVIGVRLALEHDHVVVQVQDDGIGMPAELVPRVFEMFTQAERTPDRAQGGLGIGLALVRSLVHLHHGEVEASSPGPNRGSTFTVRLPHAGASTRGEEAAPRELSTKASRHVLLVDDNEDAVSTLAEVLRLLGHQVSIAHGAREALQLAVDGERWDTCILDIGLPEMSGYELGNRIRQMPGMEAATLIALTGYGQARDRALAKTAGFDHHLVKPADITRLMAIIDSP